MVLEDSLPSVGRIELSNVSFWSKSRRVYSSECFEEESRLVGRNMIYRGECTVATAFVCGNIAVTVATSLQIALNIQL